jgi:hypothetical protein
VTVIGSVGDGLGVREGVTVKVGVEVSVGVGVEVTVAVEVGVKVDVAVSVQVGVGVTLAKTCARPEQPERNMVKANKTGVKKIGGKLFIMISINE